MSRPVGTAVGAGRLLRAALLLALGAPALAAQGTAGFVVRKGGDTLLVERVTESADTARSELWVPAQRARLALEHRLDGAEPRFLTLRAWAPSAAADAPPLQVIELRLGADTIHAAIRNGAAPPLRQQVARVDRAVPWFNGSVLALQRVVQVARARRAATVHVVNLQGGAQFPVSVAPQGPDSVVLTAAGVALRLAVDGAGQVTGGTIPAQGAVIERVAPPTDRMLGYALPDYGAPADAPYTADSVRIPTRDGRTLAATFTRPRDARGRLPVVVTITGSGPQDRDEFIPIAGGYRLFRQLADTLGRRGIAVLRYDERGVGGSTGDFLSATTADFAADARAVLAWLRERPDVDRGRLALVGHSEGGLIAPLVAADDPALAALVLLAAPAQRGDAVIRYQQRWAIDRDSTLATRAARDSAAARAAALLDSSAVSNPWLRWFLRYDPLPTAERVRVPTLVLHGETDRQVTADQADALARAMRAGGNRAVTVERLPGLNHLLLPDADGSPAGYGQLPSATVPAAVRGRIADWLAARLGVRR